MARPDRLPTHPLMPQTADPPGTPIVPGTNDPPPVRRAKAEATVLYAALVVGLVVVLLLWLLYMTHARGRRREAEAHRRAAPPEIEIKDAWEESAKRARTPSLAELERGTTRPAPLVGAPPPRGGAQVPGPGPLPRPGPGGGGRPVVLITGAAKRVGRAVALRMAHAGCDVYFTYHHSGDEAETLARELSQAGSTGSFHQVDLADPGSIEDFARDMAATLTTLDVLVHNASIYSASPLSDVAVEDVLRQYQVNAAAPLVLTARLAPLLAQSQLPGGSAVIAFTDIHSMGRPRKDFAAYSMSKAAVTEMVYSLARDLGPHVRVNGIAPGVVAWPEEGADADEETQRRYVRRIPLGRPGTPDDAAEVVRWLAFDAVYLTGEIVRVDGGRWLT